LTTPSIAVWRFAATCVATVRTMPRTEAAEARRDLVGRREELRHDKEARDQGRHHEEGHRREDPNGHELREQRGQHPGHEPVEPVGDGQDRVGDDDAGSEGREGGPGRNRQPDADGEHQDSDGGPRDGLRCDRAEAVSQEGPAGGGVRLAGLE
jgi:hypothetical protein